MGDQPADRTRAAAHVAGAVLELDLPPGAVEVAGSSPLSFLSGRDHCMTPQRSPPDQYELSVVQNRSSSGDNYCIGPLTER